jgi:hypothetical protein
MRGFATVKVVFISTQFCFPGSDPVNFRLLFIVFGARNHPLNAPSPEIFQLASPASAFRVTRGAIFCLNYHTFYC